MVGTLCFETAAFPQASIYEPFRLLDNRPYGNPIRFPHLVIVGHTRLTQPKPFDFFTGLREDRYEEARVAQKRGDMSVWKHVRIDERQSGFPDSQVETSYTSIYIGQTPRDQYFGGSAGLNDTLRRQVSRLSAADKEEINDQQQIRNAEVGWELKNCW